VSVDLGEPSFEPSALPFKAPARRDRYRLELPTQSVEFGAVSMGNPHVVIEVDSVEHAPVGILGPMLERHPSFPQRVNVGFMQRVDDRHIKLRVFERGAGETLACGTGAAAAVAVGRLWGELLERVEVTLPGGILEVSWRGPGSTLWQTGPTSAVYEGQIDL
jgi:diaminopimelate epimerase